MIAWRWHITPLVIHSSAHTSGVLRTALLSGVHHRTTKRETQSTKSRKYRNFPWKRYFNPEFPFGQSIVLVKCSGSVAVQPTGVAKQAVQCSARPGSVPNPNRQLQFGSWLYTNFGIQSIDVLYTPYYILKKVLKLLEHNRSLEEPRIVPLYPLYHFTKSP